MNSVVLSVMLLTCFATDCLCLRCFKCTSRVSWEDCNQHISEDECEDEDMICFMARRILTVDGRQKHLFVKSCYFPEFCSAEKCRETEERNVNSSWCETKCCDDKDLCNKGITPSPPTRLCFLTALIVLFVFNAGLSWM